MLANLLVSTGGGFVSGVHAPRSRSSVLSFASVLPAIQQLRPPAAAIKTVIWLFHRRLFTSLPVKGLNHPLIATAMT